jgi:clan AA aspartic protease
MGNFNVSVAFTGPTGYSEKVDCLVDTGATFVVLPHAIADRLEVRPTRHSPVLTAGGEVEAWPIGEVRIAVNGDEVTTPCVITPHGQPLLGAVALESLLLAVDPVRQRLVPFTAFA